MKNKGELFKPKIRKIELGRFTVWGKIITVAIVVLCILVVQQKNLRAEIDLQKDVYLFLHGKADLEAKAINALVTMGFLREKISVATTDKVGNVGDYMAMLWKPPSPDHIKIQQITKVEEVEPDKVIGRWKGVSRIDIDTVSLQ